MWKTSEFHTWQMIQDRCHNKNNKQYADYGGRGIFVYTRWRASFENFFADVGKKPSIYHTLDRFPNNDGPYSPENWRWAPKNNKAGIGDVPVASLGMVSLTIFTT
jgi:hypothetical protein